MNATSVETSGDRSVLRFTLWGAQILLAAAFAMTGYLKLTQPMAALVDAMGWPGALPPALVRFIGAAELAGALGLVLPAATRIKPWLTQLAAVGLLAVMLLAMVFHLARGEVSALTINLYLAVIALFIAWGRGIAAPIYRRRARSEG